MAVIDHCYTYNEAPMDGAFIAVGAPEASAQVRKFHVGEGMEVRNHPIEVFLDL